MPSRKPVFVIIGLGALLAAPLLWSLGAEAKSLGCAIANSNVNVSPGLYTFDGSAYSVECSGEGMRLQSEMRAHSSNTGIQVNLIVATGTTKGEAAALGYNSSRQFIPNCIIKDTSAGGTFNNLFCSEQVIGITLVNTGSAP
jgi:hypothetical protein